MTNREKYINNVSNEELAKRLTCDSCSYYNTDKCGESDKSCDSGKILWLSQEVEQTADEMFGELGYKRITGNADPAIIYEYKKEDGDNILIHVHKHYYYKCDRYSIAMSISESEDKAIHKKIAEIRLSKENHIVGDIVDGKVLCDDGIWRDYR